MTEAQRVAVVFGYRTVAVPVLCPCKDPGDYLALETTPTGDQFRCWCGRTIPVEWDSPDERAAFIAAHLTKEERMASTIDLLTDRLAGSLNRAHPGDPMPARALGQLRGAVAELVTHLADNFDDLDRLVRDCGWAGVQRSTPTPSSEQRSN